MGFGSGDAQWHSLQGGSSTDSNSKPNAEEHDITCVYFEYLKMQCAVMYSIYKVYGFISSADPRKVLY